MGSSPEWRTRRPAEACCLPVCRTRSEGRGPTAAATWPDHRPDHRPPGRGAEERAAGRPPRSQTPPSTRTSCTGRLALRHATQRAQLAEFVTLLLLFSHHAWSASYCMTGLGLLHRHWNPTPTHACYVLISPRMSRVRFPRVLRAKSLASSNPPVTRRGDRPGRVNLTISVWLRSLVPQRCVRVRSELNAASAWRGNGWLNRPVPPQVDGRHGLPARAWVG